METISTRDARIHFSALLERVEGGEEITITKHGRPVARLVPVTTVSRSRIDETTARIRAFRAGRRLGRLDWRSLRDEARR